MAGVENRVVDEATSLEKLAAVVEERAERVLRNAELARQEAAHAGAEDSRARDLHLWEADAHERSAKLLERTAALYRSRARDLRAQRPSHHASPSG